MQRALKWIRIIIIFVFILSILFFLFLQTNSAKKLIRGKLQTYLTAKTGGDFRISNIDYGLPKWISIKEFSVRDKSGDTVLEGEKLVVEMNLFKLLSGQFEINRVELDKVNVTINRKQGDSTFNYQFIIDAFTTRSSAVKKDTTPLVFSLHDIHINNSNLRWKDPINGTELHTRIGRMDVIFDSIDIVKNRFSIRESVIGDVLFEMNISPSRVQNENIVPYALPFIRLNKSHITKTHVIYNDDNTGINTNDSITNLQLDNAIMQTTGSILIDKLLLSNSDVTVNRRSFDNAKKRIDTSIGVMVNDSLGVFHIKELGLFDNNIIYNDIAQASKSNGLDIHHINLKKLIVKAGNIDYTGNKMNASITSLSGRDKSGFAVDSLQGNFSVTDSLVNIGNLFIKTPYSRITGSAVVYPFIFSNGNRGNVQNRIRFSNNNISKTDLQLLVPEEVRKYHKQLQGISTIYLDAEADGNVKKANIHRLVLSSDKKDIFIDAGGTVTNALSKKNIQFDATIKQLSVTKNVLQGFMDQKSRQKINLPPLMSIKGKISGNMTELNNDLTVNSAYGMATIKGKLRNYTKPEKLVYNIKILAKNIETGKWINRDSLFGKVNGTVSLKGSGIDYKTATVESLIDLTSFRLKNHDYTGIHLNLNGTKGSYDFNGNTNDPLLMINIRGSTSLNKTYPSIQSFFNIQNANLFALGLYADTLAFKTKGIIDLRDLDPASLNALVRLDSTVVYKGRTILKTDSLLARGYIDSGKTILTMRSAPADATLKGDYKYTELGTILQQYIARYSKASGGPPVNAYNIDMSLDVKPNPLYAVLIPGLFFDKNMVLRGKIDSRQADSTNYLNLSVPGLAYKSERVSALKAHVKEIADSLKFNIQADTVQAGSLYLYTTGLQGAFSKDKLSTSFVTNDKNQRERYAFVIKGTRQNEVFQIQLSDKLKLNYENWLVNTNNNISIGKGGFNVSQLAISKGREQVQVNSIGKELNAPLDIKIDHFALRNITSLMNIDSLHLDGSLDAAVTISDINKNIPSLNGAAKLDSLQYQKVSIGTLQITAKNNNESVDLSGSLTGNGNNIDLKGAYDQHTINAQLNLNPVQFKTIEPFSQRNLVHSSGSLYGPINITGTVKNPEWSGTIHFDSVYTQLAHYGTILRMDGQQIELKYPAVNFNHFTLKDSIGHDFVIDGVVTENANQQFNAKLTLKTTDFTALHNNAVANSQLYGTAIVDAEMNITGRVTTPDITGSIALKDKSNITFVREQSITTAKDRESVMEFVDMDTVKNVFVIPPVNSQADATDYGLINYNLNIDISKDAQFNIIIDPLTRDELQVKGTGQLNAGVSPNGDISITGAYNLTKGSYQLNYQFLKRKFELQEGSSLVFSGDIKNAQADITAIYDIAASPFDLIGNEVTDNNTDESRLYKQKVPFQVILKIKGQILAPKLEFDVKLKENVAGISYNFSTTINNKLLQLKNDPSAMNKQVFGLLVMGRFIGEQSSDFFGTIGSSSGLKADQVVRESVSRFLSDAVNQVASDLIKGVDINVNLRTEQDYATAAQRTDLNLALSKRFLDDRLSITVGKNFTVEGQDPIAKGANASSQFQPDITTMYKLSKDGRYMLKAYQRNQYEAILDGYFIETGVAFMLSMDYNKFNELMRKKKK